MITEEEKLSLENLGRGEIIRQFDKAFSEVLDDINDTDTEEKKPRTITLKVKVVPDENRSLIGIEIPPPAVGKAPQKPFATAAIISSEGDKLVAHEIVRSRKAKAAPLPFTVKKNE